MSARESEIRVHDVSFSLKKMRKGSQVSTAKHTCEMVINDQVFNCILNKKIYGRFTTLANGIKADVTVSCNRQPKTKYTDNGYVLLLITMQSAQMRIYLHDDYLSTFYTALLV